MAPENTQTIDPRAGPEHGGPHPALLYFGLLAPPAAWAFELMTNFALASHACFPMGVARASFLPGWEQVWTVLLVINIACLVVCFAGAVAAGFCWRRLLRPHRMPDEHDYLLEPGEGRVRVFAASGLLVGMLFSVAILFNTLSLSALSTCSQV
jgi:hypothetical protein